MKIKCLCGELIVDNTDYLSYKGHIIADQDWFDVLAHIRKSIRTAAELAGGASAGDREQLDQVEAAASDHLIHQSRGIWQCSGCGRICVDDGNRTLHWFNPADSSKTQDLLRSSKGDSWEPTD
jgi:hypothetical protein